MACDHLDDLRRQLPDWLRAHAGWPESELEAACRVVDDEHVGATVEMTGTGVHLHLDSGRDLELVASSA